MCFGFVVRVPPKFVLDLENGLRSCKQSAQKITQKASILAVLSMRYAE
jgi:hypothetical protein